MPWQFQTIWQNITDTCYANNMQDSNSSMTPPPSCDKLQLLLHSH